MKIKIVVSFFVLLSLSFSRIKEEKKSKLVVKIENVVSNKGMIYVNVYKNDGGFPEKGKHAYRKAIKPVLPATEVVFEIPNGDYAVAMYQDVNENHKMDKKFTGYPKEPFGFSKNFRPILSKPDFEDCSFKLTSESKKIAVSLID